MIGAQELEFLQSAEGAAALDTASALPRDLPLHQAIERMRRQFGPLGAAALEMTDLRARASARFSRAAHMFFTREGLEQSSSEVVARHRVRRFEGREAITDLCCGIGGDAIALASAAPLLAVDLSPQQVSCCRLNLQAYNALSAEVRVADATTVSFSAPVAFIDPSRRIEGRRTRSPEAYSPPLSFCMRLADRLEGMGVKLSPAITLGFDVGPDWEREVVSLDGVCREMTLWYGGLAGCRRRATVLRTSALNHHPEGVLAQGFTAAAFSLQEESKDDERASLLGRLPRSGEYLLEPDPAIIAAGMVGRLAEQVGAAVMDPEIAYLVTPGRPETPFARSYRVVDAFPYTEKRLRSWMTSRGVGRLTVKKRGFPLSPEETIARLKLKGDGEATVVLTRSASRHLAIVVDRC